MPLPNKSFPKGDCKEITVKFALSMVTTPKLIAKK